MGQGLAAVMGWYLSRGPHAPGLAGAFPLYPALQTEALTPAHPAKVYLDRRAGQIRSAIRTELTLDRQAQQLRPEPDIDVITELTAALIDGLQLARATRPSFDLAAHLDTFAELLRPTEGTRARYRRKSLPDAEASVSL